REQRDAGEALAEAADEVGGGGLRGTLIRSAVVASSVASAVPCTRIGALWRPGARPDVRGGDVPAPLLRGRARDDGAAQRVRAAEALRGACGGGRADLDGHAHVARARGALDAPGRTDVRRHRRSLREAGAELLE